jgi:hypothetical protein
MSRLLVLLLLLAAPPVLAAGQPVTYDIAHGAREVAMGGAFRELGIGANSADGNPAAVALFQAFQVEVGGGWSWQSGGWFGATWARDSTNAELAAAYSLHYITNSFNFPQSSTVSQFDNTFALATRIGERFAIGIGSRWLIQNDYPKANCASLNAGISMLILPQLTLGFAAYNLIPTYNPQLARSFELGIGLLLGPVRIASEVRSDIGNGPLRPIWNNGLEVLLGQAFALRGGFEWQQPSKQNYLSAGLGLVFGTVGVDLGWRHGLSGIGDLMVLTARFQVQ